MTIDSIGSFSYDYDDFFFKAEKSLHEELDHQGIERNEFSRVNNDLLCDANFRSALATTKNAKVQLNCTNHMELANGWEFQNLQYCNASNIVMETTNLNIDPAKTTYLNLEHCSTLVGGQPSAKISILVNGQQVITGFNANNTGNFREQHLDISEYVENGYNSVTIRLDGDSVGRYWIASMSIYQK